MGDYTDYPKLRLAHSHLLLKLTHPIHYLSFGKDGLAMLPSSRHAGRGSLLAVTLVHPQTYQTAALKAMFLPLAYGIFPGGSHIQ